MQLVTESTFHAKGCVSIIPGLRLLLNPLPAIVGVLIAVLFFLFPALFFSYPLSTLGFGWVLIAGFLVVLGLVLGSTGGWRRRRTLGVYEVSFFESMMDKSSMEIKFRRVKDLNDRDVREDQQESTFVVEGVKTHRNFPLYEMYGRAGGVRVSGTTCTLTINMKNSHRQLELGFETIDQMERIYSALIHTKAS